MTHPPRSVQGVTAPAPRPTLAAAFALASVMAALFLLWLSAFRLAVLVFTAT